MSFLELKNVTIKFGGITAVDKVSLSINIIHSRLVINILLDYDLCIFKFCYEHPDPTFLQAYAGCVHWCVCPQHRATDSC